MSKADVLESFVFKKITWLTKDVPGLESRQRAALAKLRRGVGVAPDDAPETWEITLADLPEELLSQDGRVSHAEQAIHTALTLFATHQQGKSGSVNQSNMSFGTMARKIVSPDKSNELTVKRRFDAAITSKDFSEFSRHARSLIKIAKANDVNLDYPRFAKDLFWYQDPEMRQKIIFRWGGDFWVTIKKNQNQTEGEES